MYNANSVDLSKYDNVFCDSLQALEWAYQNGLPRSATIKSSAPAMLWGKSENIHNIESRWSAKELEVFQSEILKLTEDMFDAALKISGIERELALVVSRSAHQFQRVIYKAACLESDDFTQPRLFVYVNGKSGSAGNIMNSLWDKILSHNSLFSMIVYTLKSDEWSASSVRDLSYWERFKVAGYEAIIYRLAIKLMKWLPDWMFTKEVLIPNENELNIEIASSLALRGVKISKVQLNHSSNFNNLTLNENTIKLYEEILPIMRKRVEDWVVPDAVEITMLLFKSHLEEQLKKFNSLVYEWEEVISKDIGMRRAVLMNAPGNMKGYAISYVCRKAGVPLIASQHGVTLEISKSHSILPIAFDSSAADVIFSYNSKIIDVERNTHFNKSKYYCVGMPLRHVRMKSSKKASNSTPPIVYISTNLYHMGLSLSLKTDYSRAINEYDIISLVLSKIPHEVRYKTYPEDNRRYADEDPVLSCIRKADNIELFCKKIDMRYLVSEHSVLVTTCATSTLGWPIMSGKPVIFINQAQNNPLTDDALISLSEGIFVFNDNDENFHQDLLGFLSQPIDEIEKLWQEKKSKRQDMIRDYFSAYTSGAGSRAAKIILQEYL